MTAVQTFRPQNDLPRAVGASICDLANTIWPPSDGASAPDLDEALASLEAQDLAHFVIGGPQVLAHALIFRREVITARGPIVVGALATVCVHPDYRGRGWGADVVRAAFAYLPELGAQVALFQTGVPRFYEKLGARLVSNRFFNRDSAQVPFWDTFQMIYPEAFDWPEGPVDLNGPGY